MNILITGGTGFIGSHTLLELAKSTDHNLIVFDDLKNGHIEIIKIIKKATSKEIKLITGNLLNYDEILSTFQDNNIDSVIHFAALIEAGDSMIHPSKYFENNISGSINLVKAMQKNDVRKIVFSSTAAVYGNNSTPPLKENDKPSPENWYGFTKFCVENLLKSLSSKEVDQKEKIDSIILRYFNAAGADPAGLLGEEHNPETHLIPLAIHKALGRREKFTVYGNDYDTPDGTGIRDYVHVTDLAKAHLVALNHLESNPGFDIFNIGTGRGNSVLEVLKKVKEIHGEFDYDIGEKRPGDASILFADNTKVKDVLNWQPEFNLEDMIRHAYNWYKSHPQGYQE